MDVLVLGAVGIVIGLLGALLGSYAAEYLQGKLFYLVFGIKSKADVEQEAEVPEQYNWQLGVLCSIGVGFLASILEIGGGIVHVPLVFATGVKFLLSGI